MRNVHYSSLDIPSYSGKKLRNTLMLNEHSERLAIMFPGYGYTCQGPLLYYTTQVLLDAGYDVLQIHYSYDSDEKLAAMTQDAQETAVSKDVNAVLDAAEGLAEYKSKMFVGKSLGTTVISYLMQAGRIKQKDKLLFLTPIFDAVLPQLKKTGGRNAMIVVGAADPHASAEMIRKAERESGSRMLVIDGADHRMETNNLHKDLEIMKNMMDAIDSFVRKP